MRLGWDLTVLHIKLYKLFMEDIKVKSLKDNKFVEMNEVAQSHQEKDGKVDLLGGMELPPVVFVELYLQRDEQHRDDDDERDMEVDADGRRQVWKQLGPQRHREQIEEDHVRHHDYMEDHLEFLHLAVVELSFLTYE